jgi:hypothetical protein
MSLVKFGEVLEFDFLVAFVIMFNTIWWALQEDYATVFVSGLYLCFDGWKLGSNSVNFVVISAGIMCQFYVLSGSWHFTCILHLLNNTCVKHNFKSVHVSNLFWSRENNSAKEICKYSSFSKVGGIEAVTFIGGGNRRTQIKPPTCRKSLTNFIT